MDLIKTINCGDLTISQKVFSVEEPIIKADWCECGNPNIKLLEKNHLCWCKCLNCNRESEEVWDDAALAIYNWLCGKYLPLDQKSVYDRHFL